MMKVSLIIIWFIKTCGIHMESKSEYEDNEFEDDLDDDLDDSVED